MTIPGTAFWVIAKGEIVWFLNLALLPYFGPPYWIGLAINEDFGFGPENQTYEVLNQETRKK